MKFTTLTALAFALSAATAAPVDDLIKRYPVNPRSAVPSGGFAGPTGRSAAPYPTATGTMPVRGVGPTGVPGSAACPTDGAVVCNGPSQFGLCNFGRVTFQPVALGTKCVDGMIV